MYLHFDEKRDNIIIVSDIWYRVHLEGGKKYEIMLFALEKKKQNKTKEKKRKKKKKKKQIVFFRR